MQRTLRVPEGVREVKILTIPREAALSPHSLTHEAHDSDTATDWPKAAENPARCYQGCKTVKQADLLPKCLSSETLLHKNSLNVMGSSLFPKGFIKFCQLSL